MADKNGVESKPLEISFMDILLVITKRAKFIFLSTVIPTVMLALFVFLFKLIPSSSKLNLLPDYYKPIALVQLKDMNSDSLSSSVSSLSSVAALLGGDSSTGKNPLVAVANTILNTSDFLDEIIKVNRFDLRENPNYENLAPKSLESFYMGLRGKVRKEIGFKYDEDTDFITVSFKDYDPQVAYSTTKSILELLKKKLVNIAKNKASSKKEYLTEKIESGKITTETAIKELINYQRSNDNYTGTAASEVLVRRILTLDNEIVTKRQALELLKTYSAANSPEIKLLQSEITSLENFKASEQEKLSGGSSPQLQESVEYIRLQKNIELAQTLLSLYSAEYAKAEIEENAQNASFIVIQEPKVLLIKSGPSRASIVLIGGIVVFLLSIFVAFIIEYFAQCALDREEGQRFRKSVKT